jgi:UDP-N-acetylglucosamine 2-epimerase
VNQTEGTLVVVDSIELEQRLEKLGLNVNQISHFTPINSPQELEAYDKALGAVRKLTHYITDLKFRGVSIYAGIGPLLIDYMVFLNKIDFIFSKTISEGKLTHLVLAVSGNPFYGQTVLDLAEDYGFQVANLPGVSSFRRPSLPFVGALVNWVYWFYRFLSTYSSMSVRVSAEKILRGRECCTVMLLQTNEYGLYMQPVYPLIHEFQETGKGFVPATYDERVVRNLKERGVLSVNLNQVGRVSLIGYGLWGKLRRKMEDCRASTDLIKEKTLLSLITQLNTPAFFRRFLGILENLKTFDESLAILKPKSVFVMPDTSRLSAIMCAVAKERGIPTCTTLAASPGAGFRNVGEYSSDLIAVDGTDSVADLLREGYAQSRLVLIGNPVLDEYVKRPVVEDQKYVSEFVATDFSKHIVLVATSRFDPDGERVWIRRLVEMANRRGDCEIVVKIHPLYQELDYALLKADCAGLRFFVVGRECEVLSLIKVADVVLTDYSHIGKGTVVLDKPLVTVNLTGRELPANRYADDGVAVGVTKLEELEAVVAKILEGDAELLSALEHRRREAVNKYNYKNDGKAASRLLHLLLEPSKPS